MFTIGFNSSTILIPRVPVAWLKPFMVLYCNSYLVSFGNAVRFDVFDEVVRIAAIKTPIVLRFPNTRFSISNVYLTAVAELKKIYCALMGHAQVGLEIVVRTVVPFAFVQ